MMCSRTGSTLIDGRRRRSRRGAARMPHSSSAGKAGAMQRVKGMVSIVAAGVVLMAADHALAQQKFPARPLRLVVGLAPGGTLDTLARITGQKMSEHWGQPVVVENRPGGSTVVSANVVAKAAPDGYTLLVILGSFPAAAATMPKLPYDPIKDFSSVTQFGYGTGVVVVAPGLGVKSVKELIALAQDKPGQVMAATIGAGSSNHLSMERIRLAAGIKLGFVAFKGGPDAITQVVGGRVHFTMQSLLSSYGFIKDGRVIPIAVSLPNRAPQLPDVPTLAETLPDFKRNDASYGLLAPAGTPRPVINQLNKEVGRILELPDVRERLQAVGFYIEPSTPEEFDKILRRQIEGLSKVAKDAGLIAK
jgi:tripartite-type tricarboxylate transporter receptor subunit TctC